MSKFLVIDGLDGSGKGTVTRMPKDYLTAKGVDLMEETIDDNGVAFGDPARQ